MTLSAIPFKKTAQYFTQEIANGITIDLVSIPGGEFLMGSPETEADRQSNEGPQRLVKVQPFFMGKYPVTQEQWKVIASLPKIDRKIDPDPSSFKGNSFPVEQVSWHDAMEFCARLSKKTDRIYTLPSEAQWEYACRAGTTSPFHFGETIDSKYANYDADYVYGPGEKGEYREQTTPVGSFKVANRFGLYDMHGNVWEWCADHWHESYEDAPRDASTWLDQNASEDAERLLRGGSWFFHPRNCRAAFRLRVEAGYRDSNVGFRLISATRILA